MKKLSIVLLIIIVVLITCILYLVNINNNLQNNFESSRESAENFLYSYSLATIVENIHVEVLSNTVTNSSATINITDINAHQSVWYENYIIQVKDNNNWKEATKVSESPNNSEEVYILDEEGRLTQEINWSENYGELTSGTYRIIVPFTIDSQDFYCVSNEFEIK